MYVSNVVSCVVIQQLPAQLASSAPGRTGGYVIKSGGAARTRHTPTQPTHLATPRSALPDHRHCSCRSSACRAALPHSTSSRIVRLLATSISFSHQPQPFGRMAAAPAGVSPELLAKADAAVAVQVAGDAKAMPADTPDNIYELRSHKRRNIVLLVAAFVSVMLPFCGKRMFISPEPTSAAEELGGGGAGATRMPAAPMLQTPYTCRRCAPCRRTCRPPPRSWRPPWRSTCELGGAALRSPLLLQPLAWMATSQPPTCACRAGCWSASQRSSGAPLLVSGAARCHPCRRGTIVGLACSLLLRVRR